MVGDEVETPISKCLPEGNGCSLSRSNETDGAVVLRVNKFCDDGVFVSGLLGEAGMTADILLDEGSAVAQIVSGDGIRASRQ